MRWTPAIASVPLLLAMCTGSFAYYAGTGPGPGLTGNDTGGIIQWTPEIAYTYREIAADHCARWNRGVAITSLHRRYGDYVGFRCVTDRRNDPRKSWYYSSSWFAP